MTPMGVIFRSAFTSFSAWGRQVVASGVHPKRVWILSVPKQDTKRCSDSIQAGAKVILLG